MIYPQTLFELLGPVHYWGFRSSRLQMFLHIKTIELYGLWSRGKGLECKGSGPVFWNLRLGPVVVGG